MMEERAPRARQAHDEEWVRDFLRADLRMTLAVVLETQAIREKADDVLPGRDAAHECEPGLGLESLQYHPKGLAEAVVAQIVQRAASSRLRSSRETRGSPTRLSMEPAAFVVRTVARSALDVSVIVFDLLSTTGNLPVVCC
jgi:hypothetical protein